MDVTPPVAEIERRLRWPALPALVFLGLMVGLLAVAAVSMWLRPDHPGGLPVDAALLARVHAAEQALAHYTRRHPGEPRVRAALGALALARHDYTAAATRYREACERAPHYGEGRLGWGVALALDASRTADPWQRRALTLRAIAQFAAVDASLPEYPHALYDRARLLAEVGRATEARTMADRYLALDPSGPWAERLRSELGGS